LLGKFAAEKVLLLNPGAVILAGQMFDLDKGLYNTVVESCEGYLQNSFSDIKGVNSHPIYLQANMNRFSVAHYSALQVMNEFYGLFYIKA